MLLKKLALRQRVLTPQVRKVHVLKNTVVFDLKLEALFTNYNVGYVDDAPIFTISVISLSKLM